MSTYCYITSHTVLYLFLCMALCAAGVTLGVGGGSSTSTAPLSNAECHDEHSNMHSEIEQNSQQVKTTTQREEKQVTTDASCECTEEKEKRPCEQQTGQLVKEVRLCEQL